MSSRIKNILRKVTLALFIMVVIFGAFHAQQVQAADPATSASSTNAFGINNLTSNLAFCGGASDVLNGGFRYGLFCYFSLALQLIVLVVLYGIGAVFAILLSGFVYASQWMIGFGTELTTKLGAIPVGFKMALELADLLFIIAIILIAFSTILRWHEYEAKKMLPRLIFAALLVNFSLLIAGLMLDASNVFTNFFLSHFDAESVGRALNSQSAILDGKYKIGGGEHSWEDFIVIFPQVIFAIIITFMMMMSMIAVFIMALVRNLWVVVLLVTMPLAWGSWVIPKLEGYWKKWWENFINWGVLYLPIVTFFLFLAFRTLNKETITGATAAPGAAVGTVGAGVIPVAAQAAGFGDFINTALSNAVSSLIVIGIILAGLKVAQSLGSTVAGTFANLASRGGRKLAGGLLKGSASLGGAAGGAMAAPIVKPILKGGRWVGTKISDATGIGTMTLEGEEGGFARGLGVAKRIFGGMSGAAKKVGGFTGITAGAGFGANLAGGHNLYGRATEFLSRGAAGLSFLPLMPEVAQFLGRTSAAQGEAVNRAMKEVDGLSPAAIKAWIQSAALKDAAHQAAAMAVADKNHMHEAIPSSLIERFSDSVAAFNNGVERKKIDLLKAHAAHNPFEAEGISGETTADVFKRLDGDGARGLDMSHWAHNDPTRIAKALSMMSDPQKRAAASRDEFAKNEVLAHAVGRLAKAFDAFKLPDEQKMVADFNEAIKGVRDPELMKRIEGHLEAIHDSGKKELREAIAAKDASARSALGFAKDVAHAVISTKSKSEHPAHGSPDYELRALLGGLFKSSGGSKSSSHSSVPKGDSHGHGH